MKVTTRPLYTFTRPVIRLHVVYIKVFRIAYMKILHVVDMKELHVVRKTVPNHNPRSSVPF